MTKPSSEVTVQNHVDTTDWTLLMIVDDANGNGKAIHDMAVNAFKTEQTHRKTLLFDANKLPHSGYPPRINDRKAGCFVVLARNSRRAVKRGPIADLLKTTGTPSIRAIRRAFLSGDKG